MTNFYPIIEDSTAIFHNLPLTTNISGDACAGGDVCNCGDYGDCGSCSESCNCGDCGD